MPGEWFVDDAGQGKLVAPGIMTLSQVAHTHEG